MRASFVLSEIGIGLRRNVTMTVAVIVTVAISLALFGSGLLVRRQADVMKSYWYDKVEVSVYLCGQGSTEPTCSGNPISQAERDQLLVDLKALPQVETVFYESQAMAFKVFQEQFKDSPDLLDSVTVDALPESFRVKLKDPTQFAVVASAFQDRPGVAQVQDLKALLQPFFSGLSKFERITLLIAAVQLLAALLLIRNTIRAAAFSRRRETGIMRLVGASSFSIQLPFLLEGLLAGVVGAGLASGALAAVKVFLVDGQLRPSFGAAIAFIGWGDVLQTIPWLFLTGTLLAGLSSFVTLRRHLRV